MINVSDTWATPNNVITGCEKFFDIKFTLDACATKIDKKVDKFISPEQDTLITDWGINNTVWFNPPYSNPLPFIKRAIEMSMDNDIVMLLNCDNSTKWFALAVEYATDIVFILNKRIGFINPITNEVKNGNNKPQVIFRFNKSNTRNTHYISYNDFIGE